MKTMVLNLGSTSFKFKIFKIGDKVTTLASGAMENIGKDKGHYQITCGEKKESGNDLCKTHIDAFDLCLTVIQKHNVITSLGELYAVSYKAVHGGEIRGTHIVDDDLLSIMESYTTFATAHNPIYINMMKQIRKKHPKLIQVAHFETSFHTSIPQKRVVYGVPYEWIEKYGIRRYGFHGSSHSYITKRMKELQPDANRIISIHLGGSSSLCAIRDGKSIATSMGATPQSGIFHNNRVGDFDVFCMPELIKQYDGDVDKVMKELSTNAGFKGLSGVGNDLRDIIKEADRGNEQAVLAIDAFVDNIVGYIGMYTAYLGGLDAIVFTGGIGQNSSIIREKVCNSLEFLNVSLDCIKLNNNKDSKISNLMSPVDVWVIETNEELMIAKSTYNYLSRKSK